MGRQVELTQKRWKALMVVSALMMVAAVPTCAVGSNGKSDALLIVGIGLFVGGTVLSLVAKAAAWWTSG